MSDMTQQTGQLSSALTDRLDPLTIAPGRGIRLQGKFSEDDCQDLAKRFSFQMVHHVHYDLTIKLISKDCWELRGSIKAKLIQSCVATAVPVKDMIDSEIHERYVANLSENDEIDVQDSAVEPLIDGCIALREACFQFIAVTANPYPRSEGAPEIQEFGPKIEKENPFSKLSELKK